MGFKWKFGKAAFFGLLLLPGATSAMSASPEALLVVPPAESGPSFLAPRESEIRAMWTSDGAEQTPDQAMEDFVRAISEAAQVQRQAIEASCRSTRAIPSAGPPRMAWEANCRYQRR